MDKEGRKKDEDIYARTAGHGRMGPSPSLLSLARYLNTWLANVDRKRIDEDERETTAGRAVGISIMGSFGTRAPNVIDPSSRKSCASCTAHPSLSFLPGE